jgi:hypothetical protein
MQPTPTTPESAVLKFVRCHHNKIGIMSVVRDFETGGNPNLREILAHPV